MIFRSPTSEAIHVAMTDGQTANVPPEGIELDPAFHREAIARGCIPGTLADADVTKPQDGAGFDRQAVIVGALQAMLDGSNPDDFKKDGTPDLRQVSRRAGFQVQRPEVEAAWAEVSKAESGATPE